MEDSTAPSWLEIFQGLDPWLQGLMVLGVGLGLAVIVGRKFLSQLLGKEQDSTAFAVGDPTTFADLAPLKQLVMNTEHLTRQMVSHDAGVAELLAAMRELIETISTHYEELREDRAEMRKEARERDLEAEIARRVAEEVEKAIGGRRRAGSQRRLAPPRK